MATLAKIIAVIAAEKSRKGTSLIAIKKALPDVKPHFIRAACKKGVESGALVAVKASFKVGKVAKPAPKKKAAPKKKKAAPKKKKAAPKKKTTKKKAPAKKKATKKKAPAKKKATKKKAPAKKKAAPKKKATKKKAPAKKKKATKKK